jgi:hypothetical protein
MTVKKALNEIEGIVFRTTDLLLQFISETGRAGSELRYAVGDLRARINEYVRDGTFGKRTLLCFQLATDSGITVEWLDKILEQLISEEPSELVVVLVVQNMVLMALAQDGKIIAKTKFVSREDIDAMLLRMKNWFDVTRERAAEQRDNPNYQALNYLAGATVRYLADVARPLPRMLDFEVLPQPALSLSQYLYQVGDRAEELVAENKIIHPLFLPNHVRGLSQ